MTPDFAPGDVVTITATVKGVDSATGLIWIKIPLREFGPFNAVRVTSDEIRHEEKTQ
jgi:hypothetical protein